MKMEMEMKPKLCATTHKGSSQQTGQSNFSETNGVFPRLFRDMSNEYKGYLLVLVTTYVPKFNYLKLAVCPRPPTI